MGYDTTVATRTMARDQPDPRSSKEREPCSNESIWLCIMSLLGLAKAKPKPDNNTPDLNPPTDDLGTNDDRRERHKPGPAEGLKTLPPPRERPTKGLADDNLPQ